MIGLIADSALNGTSLIGLLVLVLIVFLVVAIVRRL